MYSTFGHSAIFIEDTVNKINNVYNYGTFAYEDNFLYKFVKGDLNYSLSVNDINGFVSDYVYEQRGITLQLLNLTPKEKSKLYEFLEINHQPANRFYRYDFLFDNCATRIFDAIDSCTDHQIKYDYSFIRKESTYKELIASKAGYLKWLTFGMDLMLGIPCDRLASDKDHMFLPDNIMTAYYFATINRNGKEERLVKFSKAFLDIPLKQEVTPFYYSPLFVFCLFLLLIILATYYEYKNAKWFRAIDVFIYSLLFLIGLLFIFIWTSTRHMVAHQNMGLFFANPLLIFSIGFILLRNYKALKISSLLYLYTMAMLIVTWHWIFPQKFNIGLMPFFIALLIRAIYIYYFSRKQLHGKS